MRETFRRFYGPSDDEWDEIWAEGLLIIDTNVLLSLFKYTERAREDFITALETKTDALWIPHQVGLEFHRKRVDIVEEQTNAFGAIEASLTSARNSVTQALNKHKRHQTLDTAPLDQAMATAVDELVKSIDEARALHASRVLQTGVNDAILDRITALYSGRVGAPFDETRMTELYESGAERYEKKIPPGYMDKTKPVPDRYGDLVIWEQILEHARGKKLPAIFVTADVKEDWWQQKTHSARPELIEDYFQASGRRIVFMKPERFLDAVRSHVKGISEESVTEVGDVARADARDALDELMAEQLRAQFQRRLLAYDQGDAAKHSKPDAVAKNREAITALEADLRRIGLALSYYVPLLYEDLTEEDKDRKIALQTQWVDTNEHLNELRGGLEKPYKELLSESDYWNSRKHVGLDVFYGDEEQERWRKYQELVAARTFYDSDGSPVPPAEPAAEMSATADQEPPAEMEDPPQPSDATPQ